MSEYLKSKYEIGKICSVNVIEMKPNPEQPRKYFDEEEIKALASDIETNGLLQNITFMIIISGERCVHANINSMGHQGWINTAAKDGIIGGPNLIAQGNSKVSGGSILGETLNDLGITSDTQSGIRS